MIRAITTTDYFMDADTKPLVTLHSESGTVSLHHVDYETNVGFALVLKPEHRDVVRELLLALDAMAEAQAALSQAPAQTEAA